MLSPRIVGGFEASPGYYPWVVSLHFNSEHNCGGVIVYKNYIATAAHCTTGIPEQWRAVITTKNKKNVKFKIDSRHIHPKYNNDSYAYDVAIWRTRSDIRKVMRPFKIHMDTGTYADSDEIMGTIVGWGDSDTYNRFKENSILRQVEVPIIPAMKCNKIEDFKVDEESQFCAGYLSGGFDACFGDSGGPIFTWLSNRVPMLIGLVSSGEGCGISGYPGIYSKALIVSELLLNVVKGQFKGSHN